MRRGVGALLGLGGIGLVAQRRGLRVGFADQVGGAGGSAQQGAGERRGGQTDGGQLDEAAAAVVGGSVADVFPSELLLGLTARANRGRAIARIIPRAAETGATAGHRPASAGGAIGFEMRIYSSPR